MLIDYLGQPPAGTAAYLGNVGCWAQIACHDALSIARQRCLAQLFLRACNSRVFSGNILLQCPGVLPNSCFVARLHSVCIREESIVIASLATDSILCKSGRQPLVVDLALAVYEMRQSTVLSSGIIT